tara:strand:- start:253 stop:387 length:135 start_codon:yes stop_codon:yes gene_type:complete
VVLEQVDKEMLVDLEEHLEKEELLAVAVVVEQDPQVEIQIILKG